MPVPKPPAATLRREALAVAGRLRAAGHEALLCGGAVRDRLMGRAPVDYDVATSATPAEGLRLFPKAVSVGARFGVLVVPCEAGDVEVATFRADGRYVDGRHPVEVSYSDPPTDARRRDFTVNGLFEDPETGEVLDFVGGREDLRRRLVRAIGDPAARFREDHLRILRAVRFAAQLGFAIEPGTQRAVRDLAPVLAEVSAERVRDELTKLLLHGRGRGLRLLRDTGLLGILLPEVDALQGVPQPPRFHPEGDVFVHTALALDRLALPTDADPVSETVLIWATLLHDVAKPSTMTKDPDGRIRFNLHDKRGAQMGAAVLERLRFPKRVVERVEELVVDHIRIAATPRMREHRLRRFLARADVELHLALHAADSGASHGDLSVLSFCRARLAAYANEPIVPPPLLRGRDLLALGYRPGPRLGRILRWVHDAQLDGRISSAQEAARLVRERFPPRPGGQADAVQP